MKLVSRQLVAYENDGTLRFIVHLVLDVDPLPWGEILMANGYDVYMDEIAISDD